MNLVALSVSHEKAVQFPYELKKGGIFTLPLFLESINGFTRRLRPRRLHPRLLRTPPCRLPRRLLRRTRR